MVNSVLVCLMFVECFPFSARCQKVYLGTTAEVEYVYFGRKVEVEHICESIPC